LTEAIDTFLPHSPHTKKIAEALACAVDGAIVQAQYSGDPAPALRALGLIADQLTPKA
jgi:hypothetical protein